MDVALLEGILDKARAECAISGVGLFNWNEPVLHPEIAELVRVVESRGIPCHLSSNLNKIKNMEDLMEANPSGFRISMSGFRQEVYEKTHRGGKVETVKENMIALARAKEKTGATTDIHVLFHRYKTNLGDEPDLREFTESLGFGFKPVWAFFMPLEKVLAHVDPSFTDVKCTSEDEALIASLALPLREALEIAKAKKDKACSLRDHQMTIDVSGNVQLCCAVFDLAKYSLGPFLDTPFQELQQKKCATKCAGRAFAMEFPTMPQKRRLSMTPLSLTIRTPSIIPCSSPRRGAKKRKPCWSVSDTPSASGWANRRPDNSNAREAQITASRAFRQCRIEAFKLRTVSMIAVHPQWAGASSPEPMGRRSLGRKQW